MKTSSWRLYTGPGRVSISRFAPSVAPPGYAVCRRLMPGPWFNKAGVEEFNRLYAAQLAAIDPEATLQALLERAAPDEPVLMCWELPGKLCHRQTVAAWFGSTLGLQVRELDIDPATAVKVGRAMVPCFRRQ